MAHWEIQDDQGVLYQGDEHDMRLAFDVLTLSNAELEKWHRLDINRIAALRRQYDTAWLGKLYLVQVYRIYQHTTKEVISCPNPSSG